jgi:hypothetical protein
MFTDSDLKQIQAKGIELSRINEQIQNFIHGFPFINLVRPAISGDGIIKLSENTINELIRLYDSVTGRLTIVKFVPASGAASRMFKTLYSYLEAGQNKEAMKKLLADTSFNSIGYFFENITNFAFYDDLEELMAKKKLAIREKMISGDYLPIIQSLIQDDGLGYGNLPKGLIRFHRYNNTSRLALEEHLVEASDYAVFGSCNAHVHFTVSPEHLEKFMEAVSLFKGTYEKQFNITLGVSFSIQKSSTDTIAVDMDNNPFRNTDGSLLFRPGGHGALIENLNDLDEDLVFIKNIDNVVPDRLKPETTRYKKALGGLLLKLREKLYQYLDLLEKEELSAGLLDNITAFAINELKINIPEEIKNSTTENKRSFLLKHLNKPIRVCGMVKNEGEPGGGPFWVKNSKGEISLQIVESSQIDMDDPDQVRILQGSTHFNPVDLVCGIKNHKGEKFNLKHYIDHETGFISVKSKDGKNLKAQELPGLWNGAMAEWITLFVEVPVVTFNPVKTVNDLLRTQHQPEN